MLSSIRNNRKMLSIVLWFVILAFVSTIFVVWGVGENDNSRRYVAKIDGEGINVNEYYSKLRETEALRQFMQIDNIEASTLAAVIADKLLKKEVERLNIPVSDIEVINTIRNDSNFLVDGKFNPDQYERVLLNSGFTIPKYESLLRDAIRLEKLKSVVSQSSAVVSDKEIENEYNYRNAKLTLNYTAIPLVKFEKAYTPKAEELKAFYEANKEKYRVAAKANFKYISFNKSDFEKDLVVTDAEAKTYFDKNQSEFIEKGGSDINMIAVPVANHTDNNSVTEAKKKAESALAELKAGTDFAEVAKKYSDNTILAEDGHIGVVHKDELQAELSGIFNLKEGELSDIIATPSAFVIVKVNKVIPEKKYTFEEKKADIIAKLKAMNAVSAYNEFVRKEFEKILADGSISAHLAANKDIQLQVTETGMISQDTLFPIPAVENNLDNKNTLYNLDKGEVTKVDDGSISYIFEATDVEPSYIAEYAKVEAKVKEDFMLDKLQKDALKVVEESKSNAKSLAEKYGVALETAEYVRLNIESFDKISDNEDILREIVTSNTGTTLKPRIIGGSVYVIDIAKITPADVKAMTEEDKTAIKAQLESLKGNTALLSFIDNLRQKSRIEYDTNTLLAVGIDLSDPKVAEILGTVVQPKK